MPVRILTTVDLPAPFSPMSAITSPARRVIPARCSARTPGKRLETATRDTSGTEPPTPPESEETAALACIKRPFWLEQACSGGKRDGEGGLHPCEPAPELPGESDPPGRTMRPSRGQK